MDRCRLASHDLGVLAMLWPHSGLDDIAAGFVRLIAIFVDADFGHKIEAIEIAKAADEARSACGC
mgnify:CR=1 FL=1